MRNLKSEKGAALVLVLGIIMLIMIFAGTLAAQMANTQNQINLTDKTIGARNMAKMGLDKAAVMVEKELKVYEEKFNSSEYMQLTKNEDKDKAMIKYKEEFIKAINNLPKSLDEMDDNHIYNITRIQVVNQDNQTGDWKIELEASGEVYKKKSVTETSTITIKAAQAN